MKSKNQRAWGRLLLMLAAAVLLPLGGWAQSEAAQSVPAAPDIEQIPVSDGPELPSVLPQEPRQSTKIRHSAQGKKAAAKYDLSRIGDRGIGDGVNFYSLEKEEMLGKQMADQVEQSSRLIKDPMITEYINRIGQNIVRNSDARVPFTIKVIDSDEVNAFALPGGFFYVNSGLIEAADNEAELAGVMAHEIAHVAARHGTRNATRGQIWNMASIPMIFVGGPVAYAIGQAAGIVVPLSFLKFSRNSEREADLLGLEYAYESGYDPQAFVEFFEKLESQEKKHQSAIAKAFATHPMTADRVKYAQQDIAEYLPPRPEYVVTTSEFDEVKAHLAQITNRLRLQHGNESRPTLRRRDGSDTGKTQDDGRPTLKRQP